MLADAMLCLKRTADLAIPRDVVPRLMRNASAAERLEVALLTRLQTSRLGWASRQFLDFHNFRRGPVGFSAVSTVPALSQFLQQKYAVGSLSRAIVAAAYESANRPLILRRLLGSGNLTSVPDWTKLPTISDRVCFVNHSTFEGAFLKGWSIPEKTGRWTDGNEARIAWRATGDADDLECAIEAHPAIHTSSDPPIDVIIRANDEIVDLWQFRGWEKVTRRIVIDKRLFARSAVLVLSFEIRHPRMLRDVGSSQDPRALGIHVRSLKFARRTALQRSVQ